MSVHFLVLELQLYDVILGPVEDSPEVDPDSGHVVVPALAVLVPDGNHKALVDDRVNRHLMRTIINVITNIVGNLTPNTKR